MEQTPPSQPPAPPVNEEINKLLQASVVTENDALNLLVIFLNLAQSRGAYSIAESAKIWECIKIFQKEPMPEPAMENTVIEK